MTRPHYPVQQTGHTTCLECEGEVSVSDHWSDERDCYRGLCMECGKVYAVGIDAEMPHPGASWVVTYTLSPWPKEWR